MRLVKDATALLMRIKEGHTQRLDCRCETCRDLQVTVKCPHPCKCLVLTASLLDKIQLEWNPNTPEVVTTSLSESKDNGSEVEGILVAKSSGMVSLNEVIMTFGNPEVNQEPQPNQPDLTCQVQTKIVIAYIGGTCLENGTANAWAGV